MVKDVFLFLPDATSRKTKKLLTVEKFLFTQMLRHAGRQQRLFMLRFHGEKCSPRTQRWRCWRRCRHSKETSRGPDRTAGFWSRKQQPLLLFGVGIGHEIWRVQAHTSAISGGGGVPPQVFMCCNIGHMCRARGPRFQSDLPWSFKGPCQSMEVVRLFQT